jgi:hypothetical protein
MYKLGVKSKREKREKREKVEKKWIKSKRPPFKRYPIMPFQ